MTEQDEDGGDVEFEVTDLKGGKTRTASTVEDIRAFGDELYGRFNRRVLLFRAAGIAISVLGLSGLLAIVFRNYNPPKPVPIPTPTPSGPKATRNLIISFDPAPVAPAPTGQSPFPYDYKSELAAAEAAINTPQSLPTIKTSIIIGENPINIKNYGGKMDVLADIMENSIAAAVAQQSVNMPKGEMLGNILVMGFNEFNVPHKPNTLRIPFQVTGLEGGPISHVDVSTTSILDKIQKLQTKKGEKITDRIVFAGSDIFAFKGSDESMKQSMASYATAAKALDCQIVSPTSMLYKDFFGRFIAFNNDSPPTVQVDRLTKDISSLSAFEVQRDANFYNNTGIKCAENIRENENWFANLEVMTEVDGKRKLPPIPNITRTFTPAVPMR